MTPSPAAWINELYHRYRFFCCVHNCNHPATHIVARRYWRKSDGPCHWSQYRCDAHTKTWADKHLVKMP